MKDSQFFFLMSGIFCIVYYCSAEAPVFALVTGFMCSLLSLIYYVKEDRKK